MTSALLAIARASGETAPLIFTALFSQNWFEGLNSPSASLSVLIFNYANSPFVDQNNLAWSAATILVGLVLIVNLLSRFVMRNRQKAI
jgi:phosphate transport system permease protein